MSSFVERWILSESGGVEPQLGGLGPFRVQGLGFVV